MSKLKTYTFHINICDLVFLGAIFLGLGSAALLWFKKRPNQIANQFFTLALLVIILYITRLLAIDIELTTYIPYWSRLPMRFSLGFGPLIFLYVLKVTRPEYKFNSKDLLHFIPLSLELGAQLLEIIESTTTGAATYDTLVFHRLNPVLQSLTFTSVIVYLYASHKLIESFYGRLKFNNSDRYRYEMKWLHRLLTGFGILWVCWMLVAGTDYFYYHYQLTSHAYYPLYLLLVIFTIRTAVITFLKPEAGQSSVALPVFKPALPAEYRQKGTWLKTVLKANLYYQDPELNLHSLAEKIDLHPNELSRIINTVLKKNFNDLINEYRVADVVRKMQDPAYNHLTLLGIALESGFNSKTTFNRTFKQLTGKSPAVYKLELKKERPYYNLERQPRFKTVILNQEAAPKWTVKKFNRNVMFKNYFKIAWRNLLRNKSYATINITGLAIGIAACLLIFLVVQYETSFDNFHVNKDRIYRIVTVNSGPDGTHAGAGTPLPLIEGLKLDFPQVKQLGNIMKNDGSHYAVDDGRNSGSLKKFKEDLAYYADPGFFRIFDFKWLAGDKNTALAEPNTIVLSRDEADKFFGDWRTAMGKTVRYENKRDFKVAGILENTPANTDFPMKLVVSWVTLIGKGGDFSGNAQDWVSTFSDRNCYIILPPGANEKRFNTGLAAFAKRHIPPPYNKNEIFQLQALKDMHYNTETGLYSGHSFSKQLISVISLIGLFLLIIACVNFINLATAQAVNRSKEVGVRKVLGSNRYQLVLQFISETLIITLFSVLLASIISVVALPMLNNLLEIQLSGGFLADPIVILFLGGVVIGVTLLAGFYPALVLSGFNPIEALRNKINMARVSGISLRRVLVVAQFCIAQFLVIGTLVLIYQMNYFRNKSLGFNKDAVVTVPFPGDSTGRARVNALKDQLLQQSGIKEVSVSLYGPSDNGGWFSDFKFNNAPKQVDFAASLKWADADYFGLYDIQFLAGGPYKKTDTVSGYVVNETLIHKLGITDPKQAIGKYIMLWDDKKLNAQITGVVKDYNVASLRNAIPPVLMGSWKRQYSKLNIKIHPQNVKQTLAGIENLWNKTFPEGMYEYQFLDKTIADFYKNEDELSTLYKIFAGIAIFISCLGLYGLVSFMALQRTKEVGIRKTLGASVGHIVYLFSKEFTVLIIIAFAISAPIGYYFMHQWLQGYTYRINIGPDIFILAILASVAIAWTSVGYKAIRAALANPVKSLRSE
ncbi:ABC transporter permease [Mucilaginibacter pocheonensis]|uniref:ABC-type antimicrobial peptide transport system permease subunit/AraC-like DNA-binding protein n=1 Tax=Mucilaginibacter pocheonensis TaxID=398050 RepID=A0ABU1T5S8_9SPHI|nr:ABC transporter permease [Mucilaginibacter pocheonensis]MDR6940200.1 ABC-type antimicrobial peptide transport system permease subunit/AraC-like DNA-binding protein [Mucilaginibacter pocheonensis]